MDPLPERVQYVLSHLLESDGERSTKEWFKAFQRMYPNRTAMKWNGLLKMLECYDNMIYESPICFDKPKRCITIQYVKNREAQSITITCESISIVSIMLDGIQIAINDQKVVVVSKYPLFELASTIVSRIDTLMASGKL